MIKIPEKDFKRLFHTYPNYEDIISKMEELGYMASDEDLDRDYVSVFVSIFTAMQKRKFYKGIQKPKEASMAHNMLSKIADEAMVFVKEYNLGVREGFVKFLEIAYDNGFLSMSKLMKNRYKISDIYQMEVDLLQDPNAVMTEAIHREFTTQNGLRFGLFSSFDTPTEYLHFVKAARVCKELGMNPSNFVIAVFNLWEWTGDPLTPKQLYSEKTQSDLKSGSENIQRSKVNIKKVTLKKGHERW